MRLAKIWKKNDKDYNYEDTLYNQIPTIEEVTEIILRKKNGKSAPDIKNEMLKRPGKTMIDFIYPLVTTIWREEKIPKCWNVGNVTSIWKGRLSSSH